MQRKRFAFASFNPHSVGLEKAEALEWVIPNRFGGYAASTAIGTNKNRFHGLLISGCSGLKRMLYLQALEEEANGKTFAPESLNSFEFSYDAVLFYHKVRGFHARKQITPLAEKNAVLVHYSVENKSGEKAVFAVKPILNAREHTQLSGEKISFTSRLFTDQLASASSEKGYMVLSASNGCLSMSDEKERWKKMIYSAEDAEEYVYSPFILSMEVEPGAKEELTLTFMAYPSEEETAKEFKELLSGHEPKTRILSSGPGASIFSLLNVADTFIVGAEQHKTIVAGYPSLGERGRDAMIALPGLTLINGRYHDAEKIFARFLKYATYQGIPSAFFEGKAVYGDVDTSFWLIDRIYQYLKYVGVESGKKFLHTYWWVLKDIMKACGEKERSGVLEHVGGTWMGFERKNAVEVQALWYNALRIMEYFAALMDDPEKETYEKTCGRISDGFMETYWAGDHLRDSEGDDAIRPNQLIALCLDHTLVGETEAKKIMQALERDLLTPFGLRSLSTEHEGFDAKSPYDGCVWPWLLGPYVKVHTKLYGNRVRGRNLLDHVFEKHITSGGIGTVSEFLEGDQSFTPAGCISYACSVAELLRAYFEDIMRKKPSNERKLTRDP